MVIGGMNAVEEEIRSEIANDTRWSNVEKVVCGV